MGGGGGGGCCCRGIAVVAVVVVVGGEWRRDYQAKEVVRLPSVGEGRRRLVRNWRTIGKRRADRAGTNLNKGGERRREGKGEERKGKRGSERKKDDKAQEKKGKGQEGKAQDIFGLAHLLLVL